MSLSAKAKGLLWVDLETTGTDETKDDIIEIGALITDFQLNQIGESFQTVITPSPRGWTRIRMTPVIDEMHTGSGLLREVEEKGVWLHRADLAMVKWYWDTVGYDAWPKVMLAGSGVTHFDSKFIKLQLPMIQTLLVYPMLDIGVVRRFLYTVCDSSSPYRLKGHRALDDIQDHLEEARTYRSMITSMWKMEGR